MKTKHVIFTTALTLLLLLMSACSGLLGKDVLEGTDWELTAMNGLAPVVNTTLTISFSDGQMGGSSGCNSYGGEYKVKGDKLTADSIFMTEMACMDNGVMDQEAAFLQIFQDAPSFSVNDGVLQITTSDGRTLTFVALMKL